MGFNSVFKGLMPRTDSKHVRNMERGSPIFLGYYAAPKVPYFEGSFCPHLHNHSAYFLFFDCLTLKLKDINTSKIGKYTPVNMI